MPVNPTLASILTASAVPPVGTSFTNSGPQLIADIQQHIQNDIDPNAIVGNPGNSQQITGARLRISAMAITVVTITSTNGAAGSYSYIVVAKNNLSNTQPSATTSTTTGPTTLSSVNFNTLTWTPVTGATQYDVYRSAGGSSQGLIAANITALTLVDTGIAGDTTTAPAQSALFAAQGQRDLLLTALGLPQLVVVTPQGTVGSTNYTYVVAAYDYVGIASATGVQTTTGNATLTSGNNNLITWNYVPGAVGYYVFRSASSGTPSGTGLIGTVAQAEQGSFSFSDTGITAVAASVATGNTTGSAEVPGNAYVSGLALTNGTSANTTATTTTLTTANMLCNTLLRSGGTTPTDTTPTAVAIVAALGGPAAVKVGMSWRWTIRNACSGTETLGAGSGVTLAAGNTNTTLTVTAHEFLIVLTNVTPGSEAITIYSLGIGTTY